MQYAISITGIAKTYASGHRALQPINLDIRKGEIFALLGPNGAGKTTLINIVCGIVNASTGTVLVDGLDNRRDYRAARMKIGLVPQELHTDQFGLSRGLFGKAPNADYIDRVLKDLTLWDKRDSKLQELSGGMKRRVMIAKALSHEPDILFLDEPTAGVDVELRRDLWALVRELRQRGVTIILTTHYIEEAEEMADRVGVINHGELILVDDKTTLMTKLGRKTLTLHLAKPLASLPAELTEWPLTLRDSGNEIRYEFDAKADRTGIPALMRRLDELGVAVKDLHTNESSLEEIFVGLVSHRKAG
jgi:ABC-2 type transport system ATP-binding protein